MKKITLLLMTIMISTIAWSQCTTGGAYQGATLVNDGSWEVQSGCNFTGEYSETTNVIDGDMYSFRSEIATDFLTVTSSDGAIVYGFGVQPLTLTIDTSGDLNDQALRVYYHDDAACATSSTCRDTDVRNDTVASNACPDPTDFAVSSITDATAELSWTEPGVVSVSYNVEVYASGESAANGNTAIFADAAVSGLSVMATGLTATTDYDAYIMTTCSGTTTMSMLLGPVSFTTTAACSDASGIASANLTDTSADITWTAGTGNDSALVEVYAVGESAANGDTPVYTNAAASGGTDTATGLMADTSYDAYVTGFCGATSTTVQGPSTFTTTPAAPVCGGAFVDSGGSSADYSSGETITWTICPDNAGDVVTVDFSFFSSENNGTGCYDGLTIYNGADATATTFDPPAGGTIWCWDRDDATPSGSGDLQGMQIISTDASGCLTFVFTSDGSVTREGWEAAVTCGPPAACAAPTSLVVDTLTDTQIDVSWNDETGATLGFEIELGAPSFAPGTGAEIEAATTGVGVTMQSFTALTAETDYEIYVRSNCDANGFSDWVGPLAFTTPATPPVNDDCDNAIALTVNPDLENGTVTAGTTFGATASSQADAITGTPNNDVWYSFVATNADHRVELLNVVNQGGGTSTSTDMGMGVYDSTAGCDALVLTDDSDPNTLNLTGLTIGTSYVVRVYGWFSSVQNNNFDISVGTAPPPPAAPDNDDCDNAEALTVNLDYDNGVVTAGTTEGATASTQADDVSGTPNTDVWFTFEAVYDAHRISLLNVENQGGGTSTSTDMGMGVYDLTSGCDALVFVDTSDPDTLNLTDLTPGTTYAVRVYGWFSSVQYNNFNISVGSDPALSIDDLENESAFTYYPNPVKNTLTLNAQNTIENVTVYNMLGQEVLRSTPNTVDSDLDMSSLEAGAYFVKVTIANVTQTVRVIKQ